MILFPMTQEQKSKFGTPIIPRSKVDPTQSARPVSKMFQDIEGRYLDIKRRLKVLFDQWLTGRQREVNGERSWLMCNNEGSEPSLYQVNAGTYIYDMTAAQLADLLQIVQTILDDALLDGGSQNLWALDYVAAGYERGTQQAFTNLSVQSPVYASQTTLQLLLSSPAYQNQIASAYISTYSDWKGISDSARADLANVIADAIGRGINPRETASIVSKRLDVSMSRAKNIAQTEQVGALRQAQWNETDWASDRLGLKTGLLHLSALKSTTRLTHAFWHGKVRTTEEVREWYSVNGNKYRCYCSQIPVLLNDDGTIFNKGLAERLAKERSDWTRGVVDISHPGVKIPKLPVKASKSVSEIEGWMRGRVSENVLLPVGTDTESARIVADTMSEAFTRFNVPAVKMVGDLNLGGLGAFDSTTNSIHIPAISLSKQTWTAIQQDSLQKSYKSDALKAAASVTDSAAITSILKRIDSLPYSAVQTIRGTVAHESGHYVYYLNVGVLDKLSLEAYDRGWGLALSFYAGKNHREVFAESFSLYLTGEKTERGRIYPPILKWLEDNDVG